MLVKEIYKILHFYLSSLLNENVPKNVDEISDNVKHF